MSASPQNTPKGSVRALRIERRKDPLCGCIRSALERYFQDLDGQTPEELHALVMGEVERPLLEIVMGHCQGNQTKAAKILGINRSTLRKKLGQYGLDRA